MGVGTPEETYWAEKTAAVHTGVQSQGRPGGPQRGAVTGGACRKHALGPNLLGLWKATFLERAPTLFQPDE